MVNVICHGLTKIWVYSYKDTFLSCLEKNSILNKGTQ